MNKSTTTKMESMSHTLHKQASAKQVTCKIIYQISDNHTTQIMIFMSQQDTDPN